MIRREREKHFTSVFQARRSIERRCNIPMSAIQTSELYTTFKVLFNIVQLPRTEKQDAVRNTSRTAVQYIVDPGTLFRFSTSVVNSKPFFMAVCVWTCQEGVQGVKHAGMIWSKGPFLFSCALQMQFQIRAGSEASVILRVRVEDARSELKMHQLYLWYVSMSKRSRCSILWTFCLPKWFHKTHSRRMLKARSKACSGWSMVFSTIN